MSMNEESAWLASLSRTWSQKRASGGSRFRGEMRFGVEHRNIGEKLDGLRCGTGNFLPRPGEEGRSMVGPRNLPTGSAAIPRE